MANSTRLLMLLTARFNRKKADSASLTLTEHEDKKKRSCVHEKHEKEAESKSTTTCLRKQGKSKCLRLFTV